MGKKKAKKNHRLKVIAYWLLGLGLLFLAGGGFRLYQANQKSVVQTHGRVNFLLVGEQIALVSLGVGPKEITVLVIPADVEIRATRGFGIYRLGSLYQLGQMEGLGGELLKESAQEYFGLPVDGWIKIANIKYQISDIKSTLANSLVKLIFKRGGETSFTFFDLVRLWWETRKVFQHQIQVIPLDDIIALKRKVLLDGSKVWEIDKNRLDSWLQDNMGEFQIQEEGLAIRVINATDYTGLGAAVARIITNMGGRVVEIKSEKLKIKNEKCEIRSEGERKSAFTIQRLLRTLGCEFVEEEESDGRAEVTVVVGEDYWNLYLFAY